MYVERKKHFGQTALEIPLTSFLMCRLLQFAQNVFFTRKMLKCMPSVALDFFKAMAYSKCIIVYSTRPKAASVEGSRCRFLVVFLSFGMKSDRGKHK
jgi:hypothetical protein